MWKEEIQVKRRERGKLYAHHDLIINLEDTFLMVLHHNRNDESGTWSSFVWWRLLDELHAKGYRISLDNKKPNFHMLTGSHYRKNPNFPFLFLKIEAKGNRYVTSVYLIKLFHISIMWRQNVSWNLCLSSSLYLAY